ncbi:MAG: hypothetical protein JSV23_05460 [Promethearchaeota archaeon]|nr:MAG: hypothetical protein JSV23_05460 [Candidatus Lokiarchaeota archaeon]
MSYIEKKYNRKIYEIFEDLPSLEKSLIKLLNRNSVKVIDDVAVICAKFNKNINLILKKYYPEIKEIKDKLEIKSILKFYYDLIDKLTDLVRNIENFQKIDPEYYNKLIEFINNKENLINGKYRTICTRELTAFYDPTSRENLEKIILEKFEKRSKQYFSFGSLEEEIKKYGKLAGANDIFITPADKSALAELESAVSLINFNIPNDNEKEKLNLIGNEIKSLLESKKYQVVVKPGLIITDAKLLPDND